MVLSESDPGLQRIWPQQRVQQCPLPWECAEKLPVTEGTGTEMGHCKHSQAGQGHREGVSAVERAKQKSSAPCVSMF